jgi:hypothetical protein
MKKKKKNTARSVNQTKRQSQFSAEHALDRGGRRRFGRKEWKGREVGKK